MEQFVRTFFGYHSFEMSFNLNNAEIYLQLVAIDEFVVFFLLVRICGSAMHITMSI